MCFDFVIAPLRINPVCPYKTYLLKIKCLFVKTFETKISKRPIPDSQYGTVYICNNPAIDPDPYKIDMKYKYFGKIKYWYVNPAGSGDG